MAKACPNYERVIWKCLAFCGRYCHQSVEVLMGWPLSMVRALADATGELLHEEGDASREHCASGGG